MTTDRWTWAVRQQLGRGRLLPLGGPHDGAWITEAAAVAVLRRAVRRMPEVRLGSVRLALVDPGDVSEPAVPPPPSALPPGPLRITAEFTATPAEPLPTTASRLRAVLASAATDRLGLGVTEVDLRVTGLLEEGTASVDPPCTDADTDVGVDTEADTEADVDTGALRPDGSSPAPGTDESRVAAAVLSVPGVTALSRPAHIEEHPGDAALPRRHVRVEIEVGPAVRALDTARAVRAAVTEGCPGRPTTAVLVTAVPPAAPAP
ncbi:nucleopolyhedrovirus P10 family protein [Streptomyces beigongshangae]|uniref:nucleopolyhedrovirus P10 family protein n=1 Tax=Streptomyces beigongshangae TaxID=2841597 RepID=UPI001C853EC0|nr:nucleopolyhedrovirus P10 family protein [Streptomyces sp. REN17]